MRIYLFFFLLSISSFSQDVDDPYSLRISYGSAQKTDLGEIIVGNWKFYEDRTALINLDAGYKLASFNPFDSVIDLYLKGGLTYFMEKDSFFELTLYVKAYYNLDIFSNHLRLGFGEGLSLAENIPVVEFYDASFGQEPTSKLLNYLDISIDIELGPLLSIPSLNDAYLGYTIKHRSGVLGLFNGVYGGSNYNMISFEKNF